MTSSNTPEIFAVPLEGGGTVTAMHYPAVAPLSNATFIVAHGAGAGQRHPFMVGFARGMAARGFDIVTFDFPYMEQRRKLPDRAPVLENCYAAVIDATRARVSSARDRLFIGGKSMGGRMATQLAASRQDIALAGLVLLGYPLHPPGNPGKRRDAHLPLVKRPMLAVQGSRDTFGTPDELLAVFAPLSPTASVHAIAGGDHSFKVTGGKARQEAVDEEVRSIAAAWMGR